ncbi:MAG: hypothetical protein R3277_04050 [Brumimicrobium sp.]|nr:hypothetical protein [Brumimicrobium sp.]
MKYIFIVMILLHSGISFNSFTQTLEISGGGASSIAVYNNYRAEQAYTDHGMPRNEWYGISGTYLNAMDGSILGFIFNDSRFMIGDYIRVGTGLGYMYSNVFDQIKDNGELTLGYYGTYGNTEVFSPGPVSKSKFGFWIDLNYGLQAHFTIKDYTMIGVRYYYRVHLNPSVNYNGQGGAVWPSGVLGIFGNYEKFSGLIEFNPTKKDAQGGVEKYRGVLIRYHYDSVKYNRYLGIKLERFVPENIRGSYNSISMVFGSAIFN